MKNSQLTGPTLGAPAAKNGASDWPHVKKKHLLVGDFRDFNQGLTWFKQISGYKMKKQLVLRHDA